MIDTTRKDNEAHEYRTPHTLRPLSPEEAQESKKSALDEVLKYTHQIRMRDAALQELKELREEAELHNMMVAIVHARLLVAEQLWQKATGQTDRFPDLKELIDWLLERADKAEASVRLEKERPRW